MDNKSHLASFLVVSIAILLAVLVLLFVPMTIRAQETQDSSGGFFCAVLFGGCDAEVDSTNQSEVVLNIQPSTPQERGFWSTIFGRDESSRATAIVSLVSVPGTDQVYRIVGGKKHLLPNEEIFQSYGFRLSDIEAITATDLQKYPLARLFRVVNDETRTIYYLTDGGLIRPMINDAAFYSYGNRKEDVIIINLKEFNFYPRNQFVFVDRPFVNRDLYQLTSGVKRYISPTAIQRLNIQSHQIAPVSLAELEQYPSSDPVIY